MKVLSKNDVAHVAKDLHGLKIIDSAVASDGIFLNLEDLEGNIYHFDITKKRTFNFSDKDSQDLSIRLFSRKTGKSKDLVNDI